MARASSRPSSSTPAIPAGDGAAAPPPPAPAAPVSSPSLSYDDVREEQDQETPDSVASSGPASSGPAASVLNQFMTRAPQLHPAMRIIAKRDGFRRAGCAHPEAPTVHPADTFTLDQLEQLCTEPMLVVEFAED